MEYPERAVLQFAQIRNICYPSETSPANPYSTTFKEITGRTRAETNGWRLTKVNTDYFTGQTEPEKRFLTLAHEVAHAEHNSYGRGQSNHGPEFWETYADIINTVLESEKHRGLIQSVFEDDLSWRRVKYRAVQDIHDSIIDKRCETVEERQQKLADSIGYDGYDTFEGRKVGVAFGEKTAIPLHGEYTVVIEGLHRKNRWADEYDDDELAAVLDEYDAEGSVTIPAPVVWVTDDRDDNGKTGLRKATTEDVRIVGGEVSESVRKRFAAMDRLDITPYATDARIFGADDATPRRSAVEESDIGEKPSIVSSSIW